MKLKKILLTAFSVLFLCGINEQTQAAKAYSTVSPIVNKIVNDRNDKFTLEWTYPEVIIPGNTAAEEKINAYFRNAYNKEEKEYLAKQGTDDITSISENYEVSVNTKKYLIFRITGMTYAYHAHPLSWDYSIAFRVSDGKKLTWQDLISSQDKDKVSLAALNRRLAVHPLANSFFPVKNKMHPYAGAYFVDKNQEFHFLYGQYEIGPYAIGFVDVPMGVKIK